MDYLVIGIVIFAIIFIIAVIRIPFHIDEMNIKMNAILDKLDKTNDFLSEIRNSLKK